MEIITGAVSCNGLFYPGMLVVLDEKVKQQILLVNRIDIHQTNKSKSVLWLGDGSDRDDDRVFLSPNIKPLYAYDKAIKEPLDRSSSLYKHQFCIRGNFVLFVVGQMVDLNPVMFNELTGNKTSSARGQVAMVFPDDSLGVATVVNDENSKATSMLIRVKPEKTEIMPGAYKHHLEWDPQNFSF